jgi:hypothetical protein
LEKIQKEVVYSIDTLPSIFMKPPGEGTTEVKPQSLFSKFDDIRNKNEQVKELWSQKLKLDHPEARLLSGIDFEKGKLNLEILESSGPSIHGHDNYKATNFSLNLDDIPLPNKMGLHNQTGEMITRDIMKTSLSLQRLQRMNSQLKQQLKQEQTSSRVKQLKVEDLERRLVKMRDDATNEEPVQRMLNEKDNEISILKKKLKMSDVDHVQTPELLVIQKEKERLIEVIASLNEQNNSLQQQVQVLRQGIPSSSSSGTISR